MSEHLNQLKAQIAQSTEPTSSFRSIRVVDTVQGRVILFEIPPAPKGLPVSWHGHWYGRHGESLSPLEIGKIEKIRSQTIATDWTAEIIPGATVADLDKEALAHARAAFATAHANRIDEKEVEAWSDKEFLAKAHITRDGGITRACLLLLGSPESAFNYLPAYMLEITWKLVGQEQAYEHFGLPFLLSTTTLYQRIRNVQIRLMPANQLLPQEVAKYDEKSVFEAMHNCIAHQDYTQRGRIVITEYPDKLTFENLGSFFDGEPDDYVLRNRTPRQYRNPFLVSAMKELNMIDYMGYGINKMNHVQAKRYLPLPDYDLSEPGGVKLTMYGEVVDPAYTQMLLQRTDLEFEDVLALDRVQKGLRIPRDEARRLHKENLIEGRSPHLSVAAQVAAATNQQVSYIRNRTFNDEYYMKQIVTYLESFGKATRRDINELIKPELGDNLSDEQKNRKVHNLLSKMRINDMIHSHGSRRDTIWTL
ncbi:transcriptional regulator [Bifidobacterium sp. ESL0775]|uniref:ATP-binding protein n=1 Tax=Bifidobacterium sp. ESL0775 TaxID=2983230 RepID=UPI0023FA2562|nr:ATP-binding protein [Bifidobacterium sp. ESL0775]WEV69376.1 transcriptional regulator [Bifidobacterium sp. ESL0775]